MPESPPSITLDRVCRSLIPQLNLPDDPVVHRLPGNRGHYRVQRLKQKVRADGTSDWTFPFRRGNKCRPFPAPMTLFSTEPVGFAFVYWPAVSPPPVHGFSLSQMQRQFGKVGSCRCHHSPQPSSQSGEKLPNQAPALPDAGQEPQFGFHPFLFRSKKPQVESGSRYSIFLMLTRKRSVLSSNCRRFLSISPWASSGGFAGLSKGKENRVSFSPGAHDVNPSVSGTTKSRMRK